MHGPLTRLSPAAGCARRSSARQPGGRPLFSSSCFYVEARLLAWWQELNLAGRDPPFAPLLCMG